MLAGQTAYGNLLVNIPGNAFLIGGGKDIDVSNNLIINAENGIYYDDRGYAGLHKKGWYKANVINADSRHYKLLEQIPHGNSVWESAYPDMFKMHSNFERMDDVNFAVNPSGSNVSKNLIYGYRAKIGIVEKSVKKYSDISCNEAYKLSKSNAEFVDYDNGDYTLVSGSNGLTDVSDYVQIPFNKIGRY